VKHKRRRRRWNPNPDKAWHEAHPKWAEPREPKPVQKVTKLLRVCTEYYTAGAVWEKVFGVWSCARTAPILHWMRGKTPAQVHLELIRLGAEFQWLE
jgi:hypothetical protein